MGPYMSFMLSRSSWAPASPTVEVIVNPEDIEYDAYDAVAVHVLAVREDGVPLGTGRLLHRARPVRVYEAVAMTSDQARCLRK